MQNSDTTDATQGGAEVDVYVTNAQKVYRKTESPTGGRALYSANGTAGPFYSLRALREWDGVQG